MNFKFDNLNVHATLYISKLNKEKDISPIIKDICKESNLTYRSGLSIKSAYRLATSRRVGNSYKGILFVLNNKDIAGVKLSNDEVIEQYTLLKYLIRASRVSNIHILFICSECEDCKLSSEILEDFTTSMEYTGFNSSGRVLSIIYNEIVKKVLYRTREINYLDSDKILLSRDKVEKSNGRIRGVVIHTNKVEVLV